MGAVGRNDPCPCGSGKKYKQCCLKRRREAEMRLQAQESARAEDERAAHEACAWLRARSPLMAASLSEGFFGPGLDAG
ncbi:MAG: SEC-C domain-containing protein, partial [Desulfovibrio sp.]|nr:SEC-C domain-containing protein [Desulfovibrio sp.]